jgi:predicted DNA-binding mobile mystery protein A
MKIGARSRNKLRRTLDRRLAPMLAVGATPPPRSGWVRAVRESLGLTAAQLAQRLRVTATAIVDLEKREPLGKVSLETLERTVRAMGCRLVYGVVPAAADSFDAMVDAQALRAATRLAKRTTHSMHLEKQDVEGDETEAQVNDLARALKDKLSSTMWDDR